MAFEVRLLQAHDLPAYKRLRDASLLAYPEAFTSDAETELGKPPEVYLTRLGLQNANGGHFTLGAWHETQLIGAVSCSRDARPKVRHIGHVVGLMVDKAFQRRGAARALLHHCVQLARRAEGLEQLTLSVTVTNRSALALYEDAGFVRYGSLPRAIKLGDAHLDKDMMVLTL